MNSINNIANKYKNPKLVTIDDNNYQTALKSITVPGIYIFNVPRSFEYKKFINKVNSMYNKEYIDIYSNKTKKKYTFAIKIEFRST